MMNIEEQKKIIFSIYIIIKVVFNSVILKRDQLHYHKTCSDFTNFKIKYVHILSASAAQKGTISPR